MSTLQTIREPKAERLRSNPAPLDVVEDEESEPCLTPYQLWCWEQDAKLVLEGQTGDPPITLEEIVAICKEARAERYAEEQEEQKKRLTVDANSWISFVAVSEVSRTTLNRFRRKIPLDGFRRIV